MSTKFSKTETSPFELVHKEIHRAHYAMLSIIM